MTDGQILQTALLLGYTTVREKIADDYFVSLICPLGIYIIWELDGLTIPKVVQTLREHMYKRHQIL
jgi:hypothetical protein